MDVVTHPGTVRRGIVATEHRQLRPLADRHLGDEGHQVVGNPLRILADAARGMRAHRVEVAQDADRPGRLGMGQVVEDVLDVPLGAAIGVGGPGGKVFADRHRGRITVDGGRRAEHQPTGSGLFEALQQHDHAADVVVVVGQRFGHRLAHRLEAGKVDGGIDRVARQQPAHGLAVADIALDHLRAAPGQLGDPVDDPGRGVAEIVEDDDIVTGAQQLDHRVRTDVTGTAGHQKCLFDHGRLIFAQYPFAAA